MDSATPDRPVLNTLVSPGQGDGLPTKPLAESGRPRLALKPLELTRLGEEQNGEQQATPTELIIAGLALRSDIVTDSDWPDIKPEQGSYENGWGFFKRGNSLDPTEFTVTRDDEIYIDLVFLGIEHPEATSDVDRSMPFNPERRGVSEAGVIRAVEAKWQLRPGSFTTIEQLRDYLQEVSKQPNYFTMVNSIAFQNISMQPRNGKTLSAHASGAGDFLHLGKSSRKTNKAPDKLDEVVRVYVHTPPEFNGHVAAEVLTAVREQTGRDLYLKFDDCTTQSDFKARTDGLILYGQTHGELVVVAETLRKLQTEHPEMFDDKAVPTDIARQTDIPGVSIAEEPSQSKDDIQESFNSSRDTIISEAQKAVFRRYLIKNKDKLLSYHLTDSDVEYYPHVKGKDIMQERYSKMAPETQIKFRKMLKNAFREEVLQLVGKYGISPGNFAMNAR